MPRGAPVGNTNALKHGRHSPHVLYLLAKLLAVPEFRELLSILLKPQRRHTRQQPSPQPQPDPIQRLIWRMQRLQRMTGRRGRPSTIDQFKLQLLRFMIHNTPPFPLEDQEPLPTQPQTPKTNPSP